MCIAHAQRKATPRGTILILGYPTEIIIFAQCEVGAYCCKLVKRITEGMEVAVPGYTVVRLNLVEDINRGCK